MDKGVVNQSWLDLSAEVAIALLTHNAFPKDMLSVVSEALRHDVANVTLCR